MTNVLVRNNVTVAGNGTQPMLFAHGFGCDQSMWRYLAPAFAEDYRLILFDYVGCGRSEITAFDPRRYRDLEGYAQDVLDICAALDLRDVVFVGHSVSTIIGVLAANREPRRFAHLILIGPSPRYINDAGYEGGFELEDIQGLLELMEKNYMGWVSVLAPMVMQNPDRPELTRELEESLCATDPRVARQFAEVTFLSDNRDDLRKATVPSLIIQCTDDAIAPPAVGDYVHREMRGSVLKHLHATGHCPHMSHPAETIAVMKEYLGCKTY